MRASSLLLPYLPLSSRNPAKTERFFFNYSTKSSGISVKCSTDIDFDPYDLLGVDNSSNISDIKNAYRSLQKRCHPDIAGPAGHDMSIILNQAYSILSDPGSRSIYDEEQAKILEFRGYTGQPLYSTWFGSENEDRAVFVDEIKCVGCLKCALFASKTFAIESVYGRARVVAQWADPEDKINDAIQTCPVDCISIVERSNLAALEFLMSKQPRGNVRMTSSNTGGARVANIFADVNKFQTRFRQMKDKASKPGGTKDSDFQREARVSAMVAIRKISAWWYWQSPTTPKPHTELCRNLTLLAGKSVQTDTDRLRQAAERRRKKEISRPTYRNQSNSGNDEYWTPTLALPAKSQTYVSSISPAAAVNSGQASKIMESKDTKDKTNNVREKFPAFSRIPAGISAIAATLVGFNGGERTGTGLNEHIGGSIALEIVNSFWLQIFLAGFTWYLTGFIVVEITGKSGFEKFRRDKAGK